MILARRASASVAAWLRRPGTASIGVALLVWLVAFASIASIDALARRTMLEDLRSYLVRTASVTARLIDGDALRRISRPEQDQSEEYRRLSRPLEALLQTSPDIRFAIAGRVTGTRMQFIVDGTPPGARDPSGVLLHARPMDEDTATPGELEVTRTRRATVERNPSATAWGPGIRAQAPIFASDGSMAGFVGITVRAGDYYRLVRRADFATALGTSIAACLATLVGLAHWRNQRRRIVAESARAATEEELSRVRRSANIGTWQMDARTGQGRMSEEMRLILALPDARADPLTAYLLRVHPDDRPPVERALGDLRQEGHSYSIEHRLCVGDGIKYVRATGVARRAADGTINELTHLVLDLTDIRMRDLALTRSELKLRGLFETSQLGIALTDMDGRYLEFNDAFAAICGYPAHELLSLDYWTLTPKEYAADEARQLELLRTTGHYGPYEKHYVRKDGTRIPLQLRGMLLRDPAGESYIWSIVEDISERRRLQEELAAESERNRRFLRNASDGVYVVEARGGVVEVSDALCEMLGYSRDELVGRDPADWDSGLAEPGAMAGNGHPLDAAGRRHFTTYRRKDHSTVEVEVLVDAFTHQGREYLYCSARDISEIRTLERELIRTSAREREVLSHDLHDGLGQDLTGLALTAAALRVTAHRCERVDPHLVGRLEQLGGHAIETCRALAQGLSPLRYQSGGLVGALREFTELQQRAFGSPLTFEAIIEAPVHCDPETAEQLYRIAQEAVTNARRHARAGNIIMTLCSEPDSIRLEVADDGDGIGAIRESDEGMGLRIMKFRADVIGGQFRVEPNPVRGTRVVCTVRQR